MRTVQCPICRKSWLWHGEPKQFIHKRREVVIQPTQLNRATCKTCLEGHELTISQGFKKKLPHYNRKRNGLTFCKGKNTYHYISNGMPSAARQTRYGMYFINPIKAFWHDPATKM